MNKLDKQYQELLQDILDNGVTKQDRTGTGTISIFGRQIRHKMSDGFPLLTTKKMPFKTIVTELLWFLRGDTNIKYLVDNGCHIWTGDAYKVYDKDFDREHPPFSAPYPKRLTKEEFEKKIMEDDEFNKWYGDLGPIYGKQWRRWNKVNFDNIIVDYSGDNTGYTLHEPIDQIQNLIKELKTNPDSRRLMVNAWNVGELDQMVLPPCHYGFQVYTRELSLDERESYFRNNMGMKDIQFMLYSLDGEEGLHKEYDKQNVPRRAISLMWNQRSVDTFLGLPFNIASYGLLLEIIAKEVNMVPDELIGNLGDTHLYLNHIEQAKEQIGKELTARERTALYSNGSARLYDSIKEENYETIDADDTMHTICDEYGVPKRTREPFPLPTLRIKQHSNDEPSAVIKPQYWHPEDFVIENYQAHPAIKAPLSN